MEFNELIQPIDRVRSQDDFADALAIADLCQMSDPAFIADEVSTLTFDTARNAIAPFNAVVAETTTDSLESRAIIAALTSQDAGRVFAFDSPVDDLHTIRNEVWRLNGFRGEYERLFSEAPAQVQGLTHLMLASASLGRAMIIGGVDAYCAALLAQRLAFRSTQRLIATATPADPAEKEAQQRLRLPVVLTAAVPTRPGLVAFNHLKTTLELSRSV